MTREPAGDKRPQRPRRGRGQSRAKDKAHDLLMDEANDYVGGLALFNGLMAIGLAVFVEPEISEEIATGIWIWAGVMFSIVLLVALANLSTSWGLRRLNQPPKTGWDAWVDPGTPSEWGLGCGAMLLILISAAQMPALAFAGSAIGLASVWAWGRRPESEAGPRRRRRPKAGVEEADPWDEAWKEREDDGAAGGSRSDGPTPLPPPASGRGDI